MVILTSQPRGSFAMHCAYALKYIKFLASVLASVSIFLQSERSSHLVLLVVLISSLSYSMAFCYACAHPLSVGARKCSGCHARSVEAMECYRGLSVTESSMWCIIAILVALLFESVWFERQSVLVTVQWCMRRAYEFVVRNAEGFRSV